MKTQLFGAQAAIYPVGRGVTATRGTRLLRGSLTSLAADSGTFQRAEAAQHEFAPSAGLLGARKQNKSMTLIAAAVGTSGPHPEWDPV